MKGKALKPEVAKIEGIVEETPDTKTFQLVLDDPEEHSEFDFNPGQVAQLSIMGLGEATFSITSSPSRKETLEFSIKKMGTVTTALHDMSEGSKLGLRGPYGNNFPYQEAEGKDLLFIGGGIGLAPLRSLINYVFDHREKYGQVDIIYGARSPQDLCFKDELFNDWPAQENTNVYLTVDAAKKEDQWEGNVGLVPHYLEEINPSPEGMISFTCGPPIMIKFVLQSMEKLGFTPEQIITTLELKMKCGVGMCGRCNIGSKYVCVDGPVFSLAELEELPAEF